MEPIESLPALLKRLRAQAEDIAAKKQALYDEEDESGDMDWEAKLDLEEDENGVALEALVALEAIAADSLALLAANGQSDYLELVDVFLTGLAGKSEEHS